MLHLPIPRQHADEGALLCWSCIDRSVCGNCTGLAADIFCMLYRTILRALVCTPMHMARYGIRVPHHLPGIRYSRNVDMRFEIVSDSISLSTCYCRGAPFFFRGPSLGELYTPPTD